VPSPAFRRFRKFRTVIPGRVEDANPESRAASFNLVEIPGLALRAFPE
jgi:hypothetical protein